MSSLAVAADAGGGAAVATTAIAHAPISSKEAAVATAAVNGYANGGAAEGAANAAEGAAPPGAVKAVEGARKVSGAQRLRTCGALPDRRGWGGGPCWGAAVGGRARP